MSTIEYTWQGAHNQCKIRVWGNRASVYNYGKWACGGGPNAAVTTCNRVKARGRGGPACRKSGGGSVKTETRLEEEEQIVIRLARDSTGWTKSAGGGARALKGKE